MVQGYFIVSSRCEQIPGEMRRFYMDHSVTYSNIQQSASYNRNITQKINTTALYSNVTVDCVSDVNLPE